MRNRMFIVAFLLICGLTACTNSNEEMLASDAEATTFIEQEENNSEEWNMQDAQNFLIKTYNYTEEEVKNIDALKLIRDYSLDTMDYDREEIDEILEEYGDVYTLKADSKCNDMLTKKSDRDLKDDDKIIRIAMNFNYGSSSKTVYFDYENQICLINGEETVFPEDNYLMEKIYLIKTWPHELEKMTPNDTTASFGYTIVCELEDGDYCTYKVFVKSEEDLPADYDVIYSYANGL